MFELIGHRGYSALYPENTLLSFKKAVEIGCNGIELDVRLSRDNKVVVFHDETLGRITNGRGLVRETSLKELKKLDAGKGQKISTLEEVLENITGVKFLVEIKVSKDDSPSRVEKLCKETVKSAKNKKNIFLISFSLPALQIAKKLNSKIRTGLIFSKPLSDEEMRAEYINILCPRRDMLNSAIMAFTSQRKLDTYVWTIDTVRGFNAVKKYNTTGIVSNDPGRIKELL